jgi:hypothetical protein
MTDSTPFETRLADALGRYADRVPVDVDPARLVQGLAAAATPRSGPRLAISRPRLSLAILVLVGLALVGLAVFGGRILVPVPPVVSPSPSTPIPTPAASPTTDPTATPAPTTAAVLHWTERGIGTQPAVTSIWRVGDWFVAVGPESSFADDDQHVAARFIRSRDGQTWETVSAPARGMEVETGTVVDGTWWLVGRLGKAADPKRGIWTTRDGAAWQRVAGVKGLDFGPGRVDTISRTSAGWLGLATRWINAEAQEGSMLRSPDGVRWTTVPYPEVDGSWGIVGLGSDGGRWLLAIQTTIDATTSSVQALISKDGVAWTPHLVATLQQGGPDRLTSGADDITWSRQGFVIGGTRNEGEFPHPLAWRSRDGETWTSAQTEALSGLAGESGIQLVAPFDDGYLATGHRLQDAASFWTSRDGTVWTQVDDLFGGPISRVSALSISDEVFVAGGEDEDGAFIWTAPRP